MMNDRLPANALVAGAAPADPRVSAALVVTFQIAHQQYALPLDVVLEIVRLPALVPLAGSPPTLSGLLNLRGQYLPVLDVRALVGDPSLYDINCQIVIAGRGKPELGLMVDQVIDVRAASRIMPIQRQDVAAFLSGVFDLEESSVLLFDLAALLALMPRKTRAKNKTAKREPIT